MVAGQAGKLSVWDLTEEGVVRDLEGHSADILSVEVCWNSERAVSTDASGEVRFWYLPPGRLLHKFFKEGRAFRVRLGERGFLQLNMAYLGRLELETYGGGHCLWSRYVDGLMEASFSEASRLVACGRHKSLALYSLDDGEPLDLEDSRSLEHKGYVCAVKFSPNGERVAFGGDQVRLFNARTRKFEEPLPESEILTVSSLEWSEDSRYLAASSLQGVIRVWDVRNRLCLDRQKLEHSIEQLAVSKDLSKVLFTGEHDFALWDRVEDAVTRFAV